MLGAACMVLTLNVFVGLVARLCVLLRPFASSCERRPPHVSPNQTYRSYRSGVERVLRIVTGQLACFSLMAPLASKVGDVSLPMYLITDRREV